MADLKAKIIINAQDNASASFKTLEGAVNSVKNSFNAFMGLQLSSYLTGWVTSLKDTAESYQTLNARLKLVITDSKEYVQAQKELFDIAQRSRGGLEQTIGLYTSIAEKIKDMGGSSKETAAVTETVNKAIALTSQGIQGDTAALLQFKQAINSATLAGDELKSILENSPGLARAMAEGLGVPVGALKKLGSEGKLTSGEIVNALIKMQGSIDERFEKIPLTIGQALTSVNNSWTQYIGKANEASETTSKVAAVIKASGDNLPEIVSGLTTLAELYGIKLVSNLAAFTQKTAESVVAKRATAAATEQVVLAEKELIAAMNAGGTQTTRYKLAQEQLTLAMQQGGTATQSLASKQNQLLAAQQASTVATNRVTTAQATLNDAMLSGGASTQRYAQAQAAESAAKTNSQAATQRLATAQADLNAEIAASGVGSQRAAVLQQELNTAKLAATTATQRLATAQAELTAAMSAGGASTQRYAMAHSELIAAQNAASASTAKLTTATEALGVANNEAKASMLTLGNGFNVLLSAYAGWEIGSFLNKFEAVRLAGLGMAEGIAKTTETVRYFFSGEFYNAEDGTFSKKMAEISKSFDELTLSTLDSTKASQDAAKNNAEVIKAQALITQEAFKQQQEKLKETTTLIDENFKNQSDALKDYVKLETESINATSKGREQKEKEITELLIKSNNEQINNLKETNDKKIELTDKVYKDAIAKTKEGSKERESIEKDYSDAVLKIHQTELESYRSTVDAMISAAANHREKAIGFAAEILDAEQRKHNGILELERMGMNDDELKASKEKEIAENLAKFKILMKQGEFEKAKEVSEKTEKLVLDFAKTETDSYGKVTSESKKKYNEVVNQTEEATNKLKESHEQQAQNLEANVQTQVEKMAEVKTAISEISDALSKEHLLKVSTNTDSVETAKQQIDSIPTEKTITLTVNTVNNGGYSVGGEIQQFATGGQPKFIRREGGLGGYGGGDTVPAMLEAGEWIIKKESVAKYGNGFMAQLNEGKLEIPHFSSGGRADALNEQKSQLERELYFKGKEMSQYNGFLNWNEASRYKALSTDVYQINKQIKSLDNQIKESEFLDDEDSYWEDKKKKAADAQKKIDDENRKREDAIYKQKEETFKLKGDDAGLENLRYEREKQDLKGNAPALKQAAINNQLALAKIEAEKQEKAQKEAEKAQKEAQKLEDEKYNEIYKQKEAYLKYIEDKAGLEKLRYEKEVRGLGGNSDAIKMATANHNNNLQEIEYQQKTKELNEVNKLKEEGFKLTGDDVGLENFRYEQDKQKLLFEGVDDPNKKALEQLELNHQARLKKIEDDKKAQEEKNKDKPKESTPQTTTSSKPTPEKPVAPVVDIEEQMRAAARKSQQDFYNAVAKKKADEIAKAEKDKAERQAESDRRKSYETSQTQTSSQTITIQFVSPTGRSAAGSFSANDANSVVEILREAAASGSTLDY